LEISCSGAWRAYFAHAGALLHAGLDARAAAIVMTAVRNLARNGRTVMVTIHRVGRRLLKTHKN
jgi:hypothetical protein